MTTDTELLDWVEQECIVVDGSAYDRSWYIACRTYHDCTLREALTKAKEDHDARDKKV